MNQTRGIYSIDIIPFVTIMAFFVAVAFLGTYVNRDWPMEQVFGYQVAILAAIGGTLVYWTSRWLASPSFVTRHGTAVWVPPPLRSVITDDLMDLALERLLEIVPAETYEATRDELSRMLAKTGVEWTLGPVGHTFFRGRLMEKDGVQIGHRIIVHWQGSIAGSAFYHELLHEVNMMIRLPKLRDAERADFLSNDYQHRDWQWWVMEAMLVSDF